MVRSAAWSARAGARNTDSVQQGLCAAAVVTLAWCDQEGEGAAAAVAGEVDFGGTSSSDRPAAAAPFSAGGDVLVSADDGGVDLDQPVDVTGGVGPGLDLLQGPGGTRRRSRSGGSGCGRPVVACGISGASNSYSGSVSSWLRITPP